MSVQLVHCSDLHLDKNFNISNLARAQERKEDLNKNFSVAVEYALKNKPDLFLISGDVFDRNSPSNSARVFVTERVRQLREAGIRVFIIGGNHDVPKFGSQHLAIDVLASAGLATVFSKSDAIEKQTLDISVRYHFGWPRLARASSSAMAAVTSPCPASDCAAQRAKSRLCGKACSASRASFLAFLTHG